MFVTKFWRTANGHATSLNGRRNGANGASRNGHRTNGHALNGAGHR
jgi:hypothetical protein